MISWSIYIFNCLLDVFARMSQRLLRSSADEWGLPISAQHTSCRLSTVTYAQSLCSSVLEEVSESYLLRETFFFLMKGLTTTFNYFLQTTKVNSLGSFPWSFLSVLSILPVYILSFKTACYFDLHLRLSHKPPIWPAHSLESLRLSLPSCLKSP